MGDRMQMLHTDKKIKALEEQIELLKSLVYDQEPALTVQDYKKYLLKTISAVEHDIEPTDYIRKTRVKGEFF